MDSAPPLSSQDVELSPPIILSMSGSSDTESEEAVNQQELETDHQKAVNWWKLFSFEKVSELSMQCLALTLIIWFIVALTVMVGVYGPRNIKIGPSSSVLLEPNPIFVQSVKVEKLNDSKSGLELFGFYRTPPLDVSVNWSESRLSPLSQNSYKGWPYYLNKGSSLNISYTVKPPGSSVQFVVKEGKQGISESLNEPEILKTACSWNLIHGSGVIGVEINESSSYYVAVANLKRKEVMVELNVEVKAVLYDTKESFYKCTFSNGHCTFNAKYPVGSSVVLTSPSPSQGGSMEEEEWYIRFSYQPRWITYITLTGLVICFMLVAIRFWDRFERSEWCGEETYDLNDSETPLLENKDEDDHSANYDADLDESMVIEGEASRRVCIICFDAPRDCFFLPCGHCMSCYKCGKKISKTGGKCPICRRRMKKVKRLYRV